MRVILLSLLFAMTSTSALAAAGTVALWDPTVCMSSMLANPSDTLVPVTRNPKLSKYLHSPAIDRWKKSSELGYRRISDHIQFYQGSGADVLAFHADHFSFHGNVEVTKKKTLVVRIDVFAADASKNRAEGGVYVGGKNRGLDTTFVNLMGSITDGVKRKLASDPSIQSVQIVGIDVQNRELMNLLQGLGFTPAGLFKRATLGKNWTMDFAVNRK